MGREDEIGGPDESYRRGGQPRRRRWRTMAGDARQCAGRDTSRSPAVRGGQPVIRGTRVPVNVILGALAAGERTEDLFQAYALGEERIRARLAFAAAQIAEGRHHAVPR